MVILGANASLSALQRVKMRIRERFPPSYCLVRSDSGLVVTALNHVHVPDRERSHLEYSLLVAAMSSVDPDEEALD